MTVTAKLGAVDLVTAFFGGCKVNGNSHSGNGILRDAHGDHLERMDDILGTDINDDGLVDDHVHFIQQLYVVLAIGVVRVNAENVVVLDQTHVLSAERVVSAGIANVPVKLLSLIHI